MHLIQSNISLDRQWHLSQFPGFYAFDLFVLCLSHLFLLLTVISFGFFPMVKHEIHNKLHDDVTSW